MNNKQIIIEELRSKIIVDFEEQKFGFLISPPKVVIDNIGQLNQETLQEAFERTLRLFASSLLSKLNKLDRKEVRKIISKYTKPDMLQWTHQIDKSKPVATCFYSKEDYENCIEEICQLIPVEGVVIAEGKIRFKKFGTKECYDQLYCIGNVAVEALIADYKGKKGKLIFIEDNK